MITDAAIADLLVQLYVAPGGPAGFDVYEPGIGPSGICWASKRVDGVDVTLLRGSQTFWDWLKDFLALATAFEHETLGPIHQGFGLGMDRCWARIKAQTKGPWIVGGHSLGAGRADVLTGLMVEDGCPPLARVVFGEPKPGFKRLADYISGIPGRSYRNGNPQHHDLVTDVPLTFPPEEYVHPTPLIEVDCEPDAAVVERWGAFRYHHMPLYAGALAKGILTL